ncbi:MAG: ATP-binding protein [Victivallaceae bacterium]|nr:ATP-binding protein [Victivallaceae bacterium]
MAQERRSAFDRIASLVGEAVVRYGMIAEHSRILIGISGGKDSLVLAHALFRLQKRAPVNFELLTATFDPGFSGFEAERIEAYAREQNWPHEIVALNVAEILKEKAWTKQPCVLCSRLRRGKLSGLARERGCDRLALGQHLDDVLTSFLMSLCGGQGLTTMGPNVAADGGTLRLIRPLAFVPEELIVEARAEFDFPDAGHCRYEEELRATGDRAYYRNLLDQLAQRRGDVRRNMLHSLGRIEAEHLFDLKYLDLPEQGPEKGVTER